MTSRAKTTAAKHPSLADLRRQFISELEDYAAHVLTESEVSAEELVDRMMREAAKC